MKKPRQFQWPWRKPEDIRADVDDELTFHLDMRTEELVRGGLDRASAREQALREFGDFEGARRSLRRSDQRTERGRRRSEVFAEFWQDLRYAVRNLRQS